ncbi:hypothetical protein [[Clostridium] symbiosum]|uniref:hypothetical protein n=1 Tax=Clostridium symbiosum TaxID=1512 RepID=UPI0034A0F4B7
MKKKLIAVIVLAAAMGLGGCGGFGRTSGTGTTEAVETTQAETAQTTEETEKDTTLTADDKEKQLETEYKALAKDVQNIIDDRDLEKLKKLVVYPCYVGVGDGVTVDSEEEFMDLNPDAVFTDELIDAVKGADLDSLKMTEAGLAVGDKSGKPNIIIGPGEDKRIGIVGINY